MKFMDWLFDRKRTCGDCSLYERQVECLGDDLGAERLLRHWHAALHAKERDGLCRELWMERQRVEELRGRIGLTDANAKVCFARLEKQQQEVRAWCERLIKEVAKEKQRRIEAEADRDMARRQCQESIEELAEMRRSATSRSGEGGPEA